MANETRPRREPSSTSRIRKVGTPASTSPADDNGTITPVSAPSNQDAAESMPAAGHEYRERHESYRAVEERPADREPIRFRGDRETLRELRERDREPASGLP